jgi:hypothetical protein
MVSIRCTNMKLSPSFSSYVLDCGLRMALAVVLVTGLRHVQIRWKDDRVIYNAGIQSSQSCQLEVWSEASHSVLSRAEI